MNKPTQEELLKENLLPENLRLSPFTIVSRWLNEATELAWQPNPNAMVVSTVRESTVKKIENATIFDNDALEEKPTHRMHVSCYVKTLMSKKATWCFLPIINPPRASN